MACKNNVPLNLKQHAVLEQVEKENWWTTGSGAIWILYLLTTPGEPGNGC